MFATRASAGPQFLPDLLDLASAADGDHQRKTHASKHQDTGDSLKLSLDLLPRLQTLSNSALVHQRALAAGSAVGDHLAVASVQTGASVPLMIGNRPKCVLNLLDQQQHQQAPHSTGQTAAPTSGPQNTALRAEQRRQNQSISVVRPVVVVNGTSGTDGSLGSKSSSSSSSTYSLIDDWMSLDVAAHAHARPGATTIDELLLSLKASGLDPHSGSCRAPPRSEQERQQTLALARREHHELQRNIGRQHQFMVDKLEERKRNLSIVQCVWAQRDFKHAIEKLVDIYHQGLVFAPSSPADPQHACKLKSLNTALAVDVISIIILRPKLWTLEVCQLLLPIINQDLLLQSQHEYYAEVGLKALKLILAHFSAIIASTLDSLKESDKLVGVDLSREDRINKCVACYKLLLESRSVMSQQQFAPKQRQPADGQQCKLVAFQRELQAMFSSLFDSIQLDPRLMAKRFCG